MCIDHSCSHCWLLTDQCRCNVPQRVSQFIGKVQGIPYFFEANISAILKLCCFQHLKTLWTKQVLEYQQNSNCKNISYKTFTILKQQNGRYFRNGPENSKHPCCDILRHQFRLSSPKNYEPNARPGKHQPL